jgi:hypothetical protein
MLITPIPLERYRPLSIAQCSAVSPTRTAPPSGPGGVGSFRLISATQLPEQSRCTVTLPDGLARCAIGRLNISQRGRRPLAEHASGTRRPQSIPARAFRRRLHPPRQRPTLSLQTWLFRSAGRTTTSKSRCSGGSIVFPGDSAFRVGSVYTSFKPESSTCSMSRPTSSSVFHQEDARHRLCLSFQFGPKGSCPPSLRSPWLMASWSVPSQPAVYSPLAMLLSFARSAARKLPRGTAAAAHLFREGAFGKTRFQSPRHRRISLVGRWAVHR